MIVQGNKSNIQFEIKIIQTSISDTHIKNLKTDFQSTNNFSIIIKK